MSVLGQQSSGTIGGTVYDTSNAVIPNASVELKSEATNAIRQTVSNGDGFFRFAAVQPGTYTVTVSAPSFKSWQIQGVQLNQGGNLTIPNIALQVGGTKQEVEVVAANDVTVPTDTGQVSTTLNQHMISQLSIAGRDAAELIKIMPGMAIANGLNQGSSFNPTGATASNTGPIGAYSAQGTQPNGAMTMTLDGANLLDPGNQGTQTANINSDQTAEVTLLTNAYGAEFAKGPVTFQAIGKSGGAQFHGSGYFYAKNGILNSTDSYIKNQGIAKSDESYYYPGGDIGGPVLLPWTKFNHNRDKLFFYAAYEYMKQQPGATSSSLQNRFVPTSEMLGGNFSPGYLATLGSNFANNYPGGATALSGDTFPGGMIPANLLDPNSAVLAKTFPAANADPTANSAGANYQALLVPPQNRYEVRLRGDYNISDNTKFYFSWDRQHEIDQNPISVWWWLPGALPYPSTQDAIQISKVYNANLTHVFSPTLTNEFVFSSASFLNPINLGNPDAVNPDKLGFQMQGMFSNPFTPLIPNFFSGWGGSGNMGFGYSAPTYGETGFPAGFGKLSQAPNLYDNVTKVLGTHTIKAGFYWDFARNQQTGAGWQYSDQGTAYFDNWGGQSTSNPIANFMMARMATFYQQNGGAVADFKYYQYSFYAQDSWKAGRRLTLTYGLRFDHMGQWAPTSGPGLAVWDQSKYVNDSTAPSWTGLQWNKINSSIPRSGFPSKPFFYEPRVGAAYDLFGNGKTVIRGGFGVYRYQLAYNSVSGGGYNAPLGIEQAAATSGPTGWTDPINYAPASGGVVGIGSNTTGVLTMGDDRTPYTQTYNITLSQRAPWNSVAEFQYSGSRSRDMLLNSGLQSINKIPVGAYFNGPDRTGNYQDVTSSSFNQYLYTPLANYQNMQLVTHGSYSNYNALIVTWQKQTGRATFTANYTFSKALGIRDGQTDNGQGQGALVDAFNIQNNYGVLGFDRTHVFNAAYVINLPSPIHGNKFLGGAVNGWELSGITQIQSGAPIQPNTGGSLNVQWPASHGQRQWLGTDSEPNAGVFPLVVCDPRKGLSSGQYFNPNCFQATTTPGMQGTYIWPYVKGPGYFNSDLSIYKNFNFKEHQQVQFRFQAYNFLNHPLPQFNANGSQSDIKLSYIGATVNGVQQYTVNNQNALTTGKVLNTVGRRVIQLSLKYNF